MALSELLNFSLSDLPSVLRYVLYGSLICSVLALLLQFIGFVTPGWITLASPTGLTVSAGVWYIQVCIPPKCRTASMTRVVNPFNVAGDNAGKYSFCEMSRRERHACCIDFDQLDICLFRSEVSLPLI